MKRRLAIVAALLPLVFSCSRAPSEDGAAVLERAIATYRTEGPKAALAEFERARGLFRRTGDRAGEARSLSALGSATKAGGDIPGGIRLLSDALSIQRSLGNDLETGKVLSNLGLAYHASGSYTEAMQHFDEALTLARRAGDRRLEGAVQNNAAMVLDEQGEYRAALERYEAALAAARESGFDRLTSDALGNIGGVHLLLGRYREAAASYREAYTVSNRLGLGPGMSKDLGNLAASLLGLGELQEALSTYDEALKLARAGGLALDEADWQLGRARVLRQRGEYDNALASLGGALALYEKSGAERERADALLERGWLLLSMGSDSAANADFGAAREIGARIGYSRGTTLSLLALGDLEMRRTRWTEAVDAYVAATKAAEAAGELALAARGHVQHGHALLASHRIDSAQGAAGRARDIARQSGAQELEAEALQLLAAAARAANDTRQGLQWCRQAASLPVMAQHPELRWRHAYEEGRLLEQAGRFPQAATALSDAVDTLEQVRGDLQDERFRGGYLLDKRDAYAALVRMLVRLDRPEQALAVADRLRRYGPLSAVRDALLSSPEESPEAGQLRRRIQKLLAERDAEMGRPRHEQRRAALALFSEEIAAAQREYALLGAARARHRDALGTPAGAIQHALPLDTAVLEFVVGDTDSAVFLLTRSRVQARLLNVGSRDLQVRIELLRDLLERPESDAWLRPAGALLDVLLPPSLRPGRQIRRLLIVPNGVLHYLPFAVLPFDDVGAELMLDRFDLAILPAASAVLGKVKRPGERTLLALAPSRPGLRNTSIEVGEIAQLQPATHALVGRRATETAFKAQAGSFDTVHLATHGFFNASNPLFSGVQLEPSAEDDGRLEVHEILRLSLRASLVTLSACRTGLGAGQFADLPPGDEFVGLTHAFLAAGSQAVLATLWDLHDEAAVPLMREFYQRRAAANSAAALAGAQRAMRATGGRFAHPFYWGGVVLVTSLGDGS